MCGRFSQQRPASELAEIFAAEPLADDPGPRFNVAPTDEALVVVQREERRAITAYRWGLIPHWADGREGRLADVQRPGRDADARAPPSATRSGGSAASSRSTGSTSGSARARAASRSRSRGPTAGRSPSPGLWSGWRDPGGRSGRPDVHDHHHRPERADGRSPRPDAGRRRPRRRGRAGWIRPSTIPASSTGCSSRATRSSSGSGRSARSSTTSATTARSCSSRLAVGAELAGGDGQPGLFDEVSSS